ncbi:MAG: ABC transporter ATP-binding protein [Proteobacteria bacterium]|nr:ABC transporter ATP-binding protein [Pseudomonadota bacterium]
MGGLISLLITASLTALIPWLLKKGVDAISEDNLSKVYLFSASIIVAALFQGGARILSRTIIYSIGRKTEYHLRSDFFRHLQRLSPSFFDNMNTGDIISRSTNDISSVRMLMGAGFLQVANSTIIYLTIIPMMLFLDPRLTFYALIPYPLLIIISRFLTKALYHRSHDVQETFGEMSTKVQENLSGIAAVKSFNIEKSECRAFDKINKSYLNKTLHLAKLRAIMFTLMTGLSSLASLIILWKGGVAVITGRIGLGDFVAFIGYTTLLIWPTVGLGWIITVIQRGFAALDRVNYIMDIELSIRDKSDSQADRIRLNGKIEFKKLKFSYKNRLDNTESSPILKGINLSIDAGDRVAIVGPTGAGKSSLLNLIPRLYEIEEGSLFFDDRDILDIPLNQLRTQIGYVPQDAHLFSETIKENILFGRYVDDAAFMEAAETSSLLQDVDSFPDKFDTLLGEKGITLSGGQRQRTALARALVGKPPILILDDSFSNLDTHTEENILTALNEELGSETTCIIVSHRVSTIRNCNRIAFMKEGEIIETGSHDELLTKGGEYADFFNRQKLEEELEEIA